MSNKHVITDSRNLNKISKKAVSAYEMWHQKHPKNFKKIEVDWPSVVYCVGRAEEIIYLSDKWEKDKNFFYYRHLFDTRPYVYCSEKCDLIEYANGRKRSVSNLLKVKDLDRDIVASPNLAKTDQLVVSLNGGTIERWNLIGQPTLCCTLDMKTLIICMDGDFLFINGGKMSVTERGIVK